MFRKLFEKFKERVEREESPQEGSGIVSITILYTLIGGELQLNYRISNLKDLPENVRDHLGDYYLMNIKNPNIFSLKRDISLDTTLGDFLCERGIK